MYGIFYPNPQQIDALVNNAIKISPALTTRLDKAAAIVKRLPELAHWEGDAMVLNSIDRPDKYHYVTAKALATFNCTCEDAVSTGKQCKHVFAARMYLRICNDMLNDREVFVGYHGNSQMRKHAELCAETTYILQDRTQATYALAYALHRRMPHKVARLFYDINSDTVSIPNITSFAALSLWLDRRNEVLGIKPPAQEEDFPLSVYAQAMAASLGASYTIENYELLADKMNL